VTIYCSTHRYVPVPTCSASSGNRRSQDSRLEPAFCSCPFAQLFSQLQLAFAALQHLSSYFSHPPRK